MDDSSSLARNVIGWRQSETTGDSFLDRVMVRQFARVSIGILAGEDPALDAMNAENDLEMKREAEKRKLHKMAKFHNFLEMWQGSQNLQATQKESRAQNKQMTGVGYTSDLEVIVKASCSLYKYDCAATLKLSEKSPLPPAVSAKDLPAGRTRVLNVCWIKTSERHLAKSDNDSVLDSISDAGNWLDWNRNLDNPNDSEDNWKADIESDIELDNGIQDPESPGQKDVSAAPNVLGFIRPTQKSMKMAEMGLVMANSMETRRNKGNKKK